MVTRTPRRLHAAEPFVTLSLSGINAPKLSTTATNATAHVSEGTKPTITKANSSPKHVQKYDLSPAVQSSPSPRQRENGSQSTGPAKSVRSNIITLKYKSPLSKVSINHDEHFDPPSTPTGSDRGSARLTLDGSVETISVDQSRRASTSSLTDNPTRSSRRARKLTSKAQALAGTKFYASVQPASDIGSPVDQVEAGSESVLDEGSQVVQSGTITPTPTPIDLPAMETLVPSVETTSVRSSTRDRKPTARAVEIEAEKTSRKRTRSPASVERASKAARTSNSASKKLSNLRYSTAILPDTPPPDSDDTNTESEKAHGIIDTTNSESSQILSQSANFDDTVSVQSPAKAGNDSIQPGPELKSPPPTINQSQDESACDLTCLSPSFRLLALAKVASEWSDLDDSDDDAEDDDALLESMNTSTADGDLALEKVRQLYCRCAQASSGLGSTAHGNESSVRRTPLPETVRTKALNPAKASDSKASTDTDATIRPMQTKTKPKGRPRGHGTSKKAAVSDKPNQLLSNKRQARRSSTRVQPISVERDTMMFGRESAPSTSKMSESEPPKPSVIVPREYDPLLDYPDTCMFAVEIPSPDRTETAIDNEATKTSKQMSFPSKLHSAKKTSGRSGKSSAPKSGKGSAGGGIRLLLQNNQEHEQPVSYKHGPTPEPPQAGGIKLRFTNGSK